MQMKNATTRGHSTECGEVGKNILFFIYCLWRDCAFGRAFDS